MSSILPLISKLLTLWFVMVRLIAYAVFTELKEILLGFVILRSFLRILIILVKLVMPKTTSHILCLIIQTLVGNQPLVLFQVTMECHTSVS